ncbi:PleD family two-component system response regulator [Chloroflexota bacterium]
MEELKELHKISEMNMTKRILIVDDEEIVIKLLLEIFGGFRDYKILCARDGKEALQMTREDKPDIIILDINIPIIDGYEVCKSVKSDPAMSYIKVLMLSGMAQTFNLQKGQEVGADAYITKPFNTTVLIEKVEELLGGSQSS